MPNCPLCRGLREGDDVRFERTSELHAHVAESADARDPYQVVRRRSKLRSKMARRGRRAAAARCARHRLRRSDRLRSSPLH